MAKADGDLTAVAHGETITVPRGADMPDTEPGHEGEELNPGEVFDPNAARRRSEGREPGLQDSERMQPAHWQQVAPLEDDPRAIRERIAGLEREKDSYDRRRESDRSQQVSKEISRLQGEPWRRSAPPAPRPRRPRRWRSLVRGPAPRPPARARPEPGSRRTRP